MNTHTRLVKADTYSDLNICVSCDSIQWVESADGGGAKNDAILYFTRADGSSTSLIFSKKRGPDSYPSFYEFLDQLSVTGYIPAEHDTLGNGMFDQYFSSNAIQQAKDLYYY